MPDFRLFQQQEVFNQASFQGHFGRTERHAEQVQDESLKLWLGYLAKKTCRLRVFANYLPPMPIAGRHGWRITKDNLRRQTSCFSAVKQPSTQTRTQHWL